MKKQCGEKIRKNQKRYYFWGDREDICSKILDIYIYAYTKGKKSLVDTFWKYFRLANESVPSRNTNIADEVGKDVTRYTYAAIVRERASSVWTLNSWPKIVCRFIRRENKHTWWTSWRLLGLFSSHVYPLISHTGILCVCIYIYIYTKLESHPMYIQILSWQESYICMHRK